MTAGNKAPFTACICGVEMLVVNFLIRYFFGNFFFQISKTFFLGGGTTVVCLEVSALNCTAPALQHTCDDYSKKVLYKLKLGALKLCLEKPSHMTPMSVYSYYIIILLYGSSANSNLPNIIR